MSFTASPACTITFSYTREDGTVAECTISGSDYGSDEMNSRRQTIGETLGNMMYVYDLGRRKRTLNLQFPQLTALMRIEVERFLEEVEHCRHWFTVDLPAPVRQAVVRVGGSVDGEMLKCGQFRIGQAVQLDVVRYHVRLASPDVTFVEVHEGHYSTMLVMRVLEGFLPDNHC